MVDFKEDNCYWIFLSGIILLSFEMFVTLKKTRNGEWKWFSPMVFLYLCTVIPSVFVMELEHLEVRMNTTLTDPHCAEGEYKQITTEVQCVEELTILVLILGRWMMPRGKMSREQLAQLLLLYLALGADILDILELMKEPSVKTNKTITVVGLCLFSWAIMQFTLVLTQTWSSSSKTEYDERDHSLPAVKNCLLSLCCNSEVWRMIIMVSMQDGPFLGYRLYLVSREGVFNESTIFFICKNILSIILQVYMLVVFFCNEYHKRKRFKQSYINCEDQIL
ncbi:transmembrane protein 26-like [Leptodactylus fuscus]